MPSHYGKMKKKKGDLNKDGKMSSYEKKRQSAIEEAHGYNEVIDD